MNTIFPWRSANRFELLIDGPAFFPRMLQAIGAARGHIEFELYLISSGRCASQLLGALAEAAARGVRVRCLFDDFGCQGLSLGERQRLQQAGNDLRFHNPLGWRHGVRNLYRDHRKLLLVDGRLGYVGGTGLTDEFWRPGSAQSDWHEVMVEQQGPLLADWQQLFERQWQASGESRTWWRRRMSAAQALPQRPGAAPGWGRVAYASAQEHRDILQSLVRALQGARQCIWLATPYFLPTWKVRRALRKAARRGVEVRLLLTSRHTDNQPVRYAGQRFYPALLRAGVRIFEYQPRFLHLKMVLVDDWVSLGSCNFDHWNLRFNLDANLESLDSGLIRAVADSFRADFAQSEEVSLAQWRALPLRQRLLQRLWGWLDSLLIRLFKRWD